MPIRLDLSINRIHLNGKVKPALFRVVRIEINISGILHKLSPDGRIRMLDVKEKIGMRSIQMPLLGCCLKQCMQQITAEAVVFFSCRTSFFQD